MLFSICGKTSVSCASNDGGGWVCSGGGRLDGGWTKSGRAVLVAPPSTSSSPADSNSSESDIFARATEEGEQSVGEGEYGIIYISWDDDDVCLSICGSGLPMKGVT